MDVTKAADPGRLCGAPAGLSVAHIARIATDSHGGQDRGAERAWAQNGVARKWRRNGLKTLNQRPEMVASRKPRSHKMWYTGVGLTVRSD